MRKSVVVVEEAGGWRVAVTSSLAAWAGARGRRGSFWGEGAATAARADDERTRRGRSLLERVLSMVAG